MPSPPFSLREAFHTIYGTMLEDPLRVDYYSIKYRALITPQKWLTAYFWIAVVWRFQVLAMVKIPLQILEDGPFASSDFVNHKEEKAHSYMSGYDRSHYVEDANLQVAPSFLRDLPTEFTYSKSVLLSKKATWGSIRHGNNFLKFFKKIFLKNLHIFLFHSLPSYTTSKTYKKRKQSFLTTSLKFLFIIFPIHRIHYIHLIHYTPPRILSIFLSFFPSFLSLQKYVKYGSLNK